MLGLVYKLILLGCKGHRFSKLYWISQRNNRKVKKYSRKITS